MLSPPSAKKLSSIPTPATPNTSANSEHRTSSCGVRGKPPPTRPRSPQAQSGNRVPSPAGPRAPQTPTPHQTASAPSPRCGTSDPPPHQTDPQQSAPHSAPHDPNTLAQPQNQRCKAPQQPQPQQAPNNHPKRKPGSWTEDGQSGCAGPPAHLQQQIQWHRSSLRSGHRDS